MKYLILSIIALTVISCKATQVKTIKINAPKEKVWNTVSKLGDLEHYSALDSASLTPPGMATEGAIHYVTQGKNYGKSQVVLVENLKTIKTELIETSWPAHYWNESWHLNGDGESTSLKYIIDFNIKGIANIGYPLLRSFNASEMTKTIQNIKSHIENN